MSYTSYSEINSLDEIIFIAGTSYTLVFNVYAEDGITPVDLGGATIKWVLSPYGQPDYKILQLSGTITALNTFEVAITSASTDSLSGKFIHQPVIISFSGSKYRPAQGLLTLIPRTPYT